MERGDSMSESNNTADKAGSSSEVVPNSEDVKTFTQDEVNELVGKARIKERSKYKHFDEYKKAFETVQEKEEADKSELQKANERAEKFEKQFNELKSQNEIAELKAKIAEEFELPISLLRGSTDEEIREHAECIKKHFANSNVPVVPTQGNQVQATPSKYKQFGEFVNNALS